MKKLPDGEYYWHDIIGLEVVTEEGQILGRIESVFPTGSNDVYVCRGNGKEILLPAIDDVVRKIDMDHGMMVVTAAEGACGLMIRFDILTIFPEMFTSFCGCSLLKKALDKGLIAIQLHDIRSYAEDKHHMTDDAPYGGGGGMVMKVEPIDRALLSIPMVADAVPIILLTPQGERFSQKMAEELAAYPQLVFVCGHYEGVDERVRAKLVNREISIGDYVLTGGELSAMVLVDAVSRLVPGVLGK